MVATTRPTMRALDSLFCAPIAAEFKPMGKREGSVLDYIVTGLAEPRRF